MGLISDHMNPAPRPRRPVVDTYVQPMPAGSETPKKDSGQGTLFKD